MDNFYRSDYIFQTRIFHFQKVLTYEPQNGLHFWFIEINDTKYLTNIAIALGF
jgi:hypothetical protein